MSKGYSAMSDTGYEKANKEKSLRRVYSRKKF